MEPALEALEAARSRGLFAAGYFAFELGYALEPSLAGFIPGNRSIPLLWFGLFRTQQGFAGAEADAWLSRHLRGRAYAGPLRLGETENGYSKRYPGARLHPVW